MTRLRSIAATALALAVAAPVAAFAQGKSPYDMTYSVRSDTPLRSGMSDGAGAKGTIPGGTGGIILRWCRPEIPFGKWQFGSRSVKRKLLDERWCEVEAAGKVGNVPGKALRPE
ncbi:MAG: hypothetical protein C0606_13740 [Hyphomicrobiales bacterium]|nr:MAG: hypothetical protein C0606_13740 [Hyphomicrobiales bacterium]